VIKLDIELTNQDIQVLSLMDYSEEDYAYYGSYYLSVECQSFDVEQNIKDGIANGDESEETLKTFKSNVESLLAKIKKVENK